MSLPFTLQQFLETFRAYNNAIGPAPFLLSILAIALVVVARSRVEWRHRAILLGLAAFWIWAGVVYHLGFFARINPAAKVFGNAFLAQGLLLGGWGIRSRLRFSPAGEDSLWGWLLMAYAVVLYPLVGWVQGHGYPMGPSFGAPCPTVIFTLGMLIWTQGRVPLLLLALPMAWAAIGTSAATQLGIVEDYGLAVAALVTGMIVWRRRRREGTSFSIDQPTVTA